MENIEIRKLTERDYDQVIELYVQLEELHVQARPDCFSHRDKEKIYPKDAFLHNLSYPGGLELGVFDGDRIVGILRATLWEESFMRKDLKTVCLDNIFVLPSYRRRGIAAKLFTEVEAWAVEQGAVRLELHTWEFNKGAVAMYEAMGMTPQRYVFEKKLWKDTFPSI